MDLLPSEQAAKDVVSKIGVDRAERVLNAVCKRIERRAANGCTLGQFLTTDHVRKADWEVSLIHTLKIGLRLLDDYNTPSAAKKRILARIEARKARFKQRQQSLASAY